MDLTVLEKYSSELMILLLSALVLGTVLCLVPQLLKIYSRQLEMQHTERMKALETGQEPYHPNDLAKSAGRTAALFPMVAICAASTVTCFMTVCRYENLFAATLAVWTVAGVVSLAAITAGVALMGRLAHLDSGLSDDSPGPPSQEQERQRERERERSPDAV